MISKYFYFPVTVILFFMLCISCEKEEVNFQEPKQSSNDAKVVQLGEIIAKSLKNPSMSNFIKKEALKKFDGDNNFILALAYDKVVEDNNSNLKSNKLTFLNLLQESTTNSKLKTTALEATSLYKELEQEYPLMQIAIPEVYAESELELDFTNKLPHVVIVPNDFDEKTTQTLTVIDNDGNSYLIDASEPPTDPVIVISQNERFIAVPKSTTGVKRAMEPDFETDDHYYYHRYRFIEDEEIHTPGGSQEPEEPISYDRDRNNSADNLLKAKFVSKSALRSVESWVSGKPEVKLTVVFANKGESALSTLTKYLGKSGWFHRSWFKLKIDTKILNIPMLQWHRNEFGDSMKYVFIEEDPSSGEKDIEVVLSSKIDDKNTITSKITLKAQKRDDYIGEALVQYSNPTTGEGTKHSTGILEFWINQK